MPFCPIFSDDIQTSLITNQPKRKSFISQEFPFYKINGEKYSADSAREVMIKVITYLANSTSSFLDEFQKVAHGRTRNYVAQDRMRIYSNNPDLCNDPAMTKEFLPGWWIALNLNKRIIEKIILMALEVAGINKGEEIDFNLGF